MRLGASPRRVHTGWNRIRFRVSSAAVRCRAGATIRFAGHRTRSDARGRASIRVHLERAGIHRAAATKPGCVGAKRGLVVRVEREAEIAARRRGSAFAWSTAGLGLGAQVRGPGTLSA
jgi:hypothetical protein